MLHIQSFGEEMLIVPRNVSELPDGGYRMIVRNTIEQTEYDIPILESSETLLMLMLWVDFPEVASGSYEYTIWKGKKEMSVGILEVGNKSTIKEYNPVIEYEQYEQ